MTVKEAEERTGLSRSNIRFYEKEKLIQPARNDSNGYREYTEENIQDIKKIAYLRTLGVSIENIRSVINHEISLKEVIGRQEQVLDKQIVDLEKARLVCQKMMEADHISYEDLDIEAYVPELTEYWKRNRRVFKLDSVGFLYMWGGLLTWGMITGACLLTAVLAYAGLPEQIPLQWSGGRVSTEADKIFIFGFPAACIIIRFFFRMFFRWKLTAGNWHLNELISDYITNSICFVALSIEIFIVLYVHGYVNNIVLLLFFDGAVLTAFLVKGLSSLSSGRFC